MFIYLDDARDTPKGWTRAYTVPELIRILNSRTHIELGLVSIDKLSLDHDLGPDEMTGYDFMRWLEAEVFANRIKEVPEIEFHTANPVGRKQMELVLDSIHRIIETKNRGTNERKKNSHVTGIKGKENC